MFFPKVTTCKTRFICGAYVHVVGGMSTTGYKDQILSSVSRTDIQTVITHQDIFSVANHSGLCIA